MENFKLQPRSGVDRQRIQEWANKKGHEVTITEGVMEFNFTPNDFRATAALKDLAPLAKFNVV